VKGKKMREKEREQEITSKDVKGFWRMREELDIRGSWGVIVV
jgi:hypothetical protein